MMKCFLNLIFMFILINSSENARILAIFPVPSPSHFQMFRVLLKGLAEKGHEVDVVSHFPLKTKLEGYNDLTLVAPSEFKNNLTLEVVQTFNDVKVILAEMGAGICTKFFETDVAKQLKITKKKYDVLITELFATDCILGFGYILKLPTIVLTSSVNLPWGSDRFGNPDNPAYIPIYFTAYSSEMSLWQRLVNTAQYIYMKLAYHWLSTKPSNIVAKQFFGDDLPDLDVLVNNISLSLINSHFSINVARPTVPNFVEVGGLHVQKPQGLSKYYEDVMSTNLKGVIYLSMGSMLMTESFPNDKLQPMFDSLGELPYKVVWKANRTKFNEHLEIPDNIHFESWCPQMEILCHKNTKLFISHGGLLGSQEAIYCGVPRVGIPIFADQELNIMSSELMGLAVKLNYKDINKQTFTKTINKILQNPSYATKGKEISNLFKDRPISPLEEAIYWTEYVIRHNGAPQLRSKGADLYFYQYLLLDVCAIFLIILALPVVIIFRICSTLVNKKKNSGSKKDKKNH